VAVGESSGYAVPPRLWAWIGSRQTIGVLLWLAAASVGVYFLWHAFVWFNTPRDVPPERRRADGNAGHIQIDFGGQWLMGRMIILGHGRELYHRQRQWEVARAGFPIANESPVAREDSILPSYARRFGLKDEEVGHDADNLMSWFMGRDSEPGSDGWKRIGGAVAAPLAIDPFGDPLTTLALSAIAAEIVTPAVVEEVNKPAIGGPLYPPVQAVLFAPIGAIDNPLIAYHTVQVIGAIMVVVAGLGVKVLSGGRIPWSVATLLLFLFPGTRGGLDLGQNPTLSLAIVVWGWALAARGYNVAGGVVWGVFAFKPIWGLAFFIVPLLTGRWRFAAAMVLTGAALAAATLPFVGLQAWFDWLHVGREAAELYNVNRNWIHMSRDLQSIPRRFLHDFSKPQFERDAPLTKAIAWGLWATVLLSTTIVYLRQADRKRATGIGVAFLFFGAYLTCYRFMYYDALLIAAGCAVLFAEPGRFFRARTFWLSLNPLPPPPPTVRTLPTPPADRAFLGPHLLGYISSFPLTILVLLILYENTISGLDIRATVGIGYFARVTTGPDGATSHATPRVEFDTGVDYPWETMLAILLWMWCGWRLIRGDER
jgi:arabinofuranan 3-O-arabinosyltransferase